MVDLKKAVRARGSGEATPVGWYISRIFMPRWILFDE
jgi:hypothetical protein